MLSKITLLKASVQTLCKYGPVLSGLMTDFTLMAFWNAYIWAYVFLSKPMQKYMPFKEVKGLAIHTDDNSTSWYSFLDKSHMAANSPSEFEVIITISV